MENSAEIITAMQKDIEYLSSDVKEIKADVRRSYDKIEGGQWVSKDEYNELNKRVDNNDKWRYKAMGAWAVIVMGIVMLIDYIKDRF